MTQIERRQARIARIRTRTQVAGNQPSGIEEVTTNPAIHHCIGKTENAAEHIGLFVMKHEGDPAVKVIQPLLGLHNLLADRTIRISFQT
jgi:hypothetical protein